MVGIHNNIIMLVGLIDEVSGARVWVSTRRNWLGPHMFFFRTFSQADILYIIFSPSPRLFHSFSFVWFFFFLILPLYATVPLYSHYTIYIR